MRRPSFLLSITIFIIIMILFLLLYFIMRWNSFISASVPQYPNSTIRSNCRPNSIDFDTYWSDAITADSYSCFTTTDSEAQVKNWYQGLGWEVGANPNSRFVDWGFVSFRYTHHVFIGPLSRQSLTSVDIWHHFRFNLRIP